MLGNQSIEGSLHPKLLLRSNRSNVCGQGDDSLQDSSPGIAKKTKCVDFYKLSKIKVMGCIDKLSLTVNQDYSLDSTENP